MEPAHTEARDELIHPVQRVLREGAIAEQRQKMHQMRAVYGLALPARIAIEQEILGRSRRMGGLESSQLLLRSYNRSLTKLDVQNLYGLPKNRPEAQPAPRAFFEREFHGEELISTQIRATKFGPQSQ
jgi:hypothetical protein